MASDDYAWLERAADRFRETRTRLGVGLPIVDWAAPQARARLGCDEDELCKWVIEQHPDLRPFEFIIEDSQPDKVTVLLAGTTRAGSRETRFIEYRLAIELEDDLVWYTERVDFHVVRSEIVRSEIEWEQLELRVPRWWTREP
ncbi:MAG: hypothetical protein JNL83_15215 [Myxococcales bacterium]|nr:hypothetical protein [Myxococcales bacterium]